MGRDRDPGLEPGDHRAVAEQDRVHRVVLAAQPVDQRPDDRQEDALLHPHDGHHQEGDDRHEELRPTRAADPTQGADLHEPDADGEHHGVEHPGGDVREHGAGVLLLVLALRDPARSSPELGTMCRHAAVGQRSSDQPGGLRAIV
jgi:hypothetical protein